MAESKSSVKANAAEIQLIRHLIRAAEVDTAYRDIYLRRAAEGVLTRFAVIHRERLMVR